MLPLNLYGMRLFLAFSGDNIENFLDQAKQNDNAEEVRRLAYAFEKGNKIIESWAISTGGSVVETSISSVLIEIEAYCLKDLETIKKQYESAAKTTASVGIGRRLSEASRALTVAQEKGPGQSSFFTKEDELKKTLAPSASAGAKGVGKINANAVDTISLNTVGTPAPPQTQETVDSAMNTGALPAPGQAIPTEGPSIPEQPAVAPLDFESQFRAHADKNEQAESAQQLKTSEYYQGIKQKVAEALTSIKEQLPFIATLRNSSPDAYEAVVALVQSVILLGREIGSTDQQIQKMEKSVMTSAPSTPVTSDLTITDGVSDMHMSELPFDQEQVAIGAQIEMEEHGLTLEQGVKIAQDHLKEDPDYYKKELGKSEGFQYDGPVSGTDKKHYFVDGETKWLFTECPKTDALAAEAAYRLTTVLKPCASSYPIELYQMAGRTGVIEPVTGCTDLSYTLPHQLTVSEKADLVTEMFIDWLLANPGTTGEKLFRTPECNIVGSAKVDSFKDFNNLGQYYDNALEAFNNGTLMLDLSILPALMQEVNSISEDEYLENVGAYAQAMLPADQQMDFATKVLTRKRNVSEFVNILKQGLQKGERPEFGKMRGHINSPVGAVIEGKMKVKHWDGSETWKSIKSGAILGLDPGVAGEGHAVSSKNPGAK
jgi:hypothetical protein